ncbi:hypothetical protein D3C75_447590 [compost metagenome]
MAGHPSDGHNRMAGAAHTHLVSRIRHKSRILGQQLIGGIVIRSPAHIAVFTHHHGNIQAALIEEPLHSSSLLPEGKRIGTVMMP